jgi:P27 family predicted phage terminase small subunit
VAKRGRKSSAELATPRIVVPAPAPGPRPLPPDHLSPAMKAWWRTVVDDYNFDQHHLRLLEAACGAWDRMVQARGAIDEHGLVFLDRHDEPRTRPEVAIERDARISFARLVRELDLDVSSEPPRPPGLRSNRRW